MRTIESIPAAVAPTPRRAARDAAVGECDEREKSDEADDAELGEELEPRLWGWRM